MSEEEKSITALIHRIAPALSDHVTIEFLNQIDGKDVFELETREKKLVLKGNNGVSVASALKYYLEHFCNSSITWNGTNIRIPSTLPEIPQKIRKISPYKFRHYLNYCAFNYTMAWWDWERWQKEIDWMALNGINMPLALTGEEAIWQKVYHQLGFTDQELNSFFSGPAYFAWLWMANLDGWGGPLPQSWIDSHQALQKKILAYERSLGMTPILPAFTGHVPPHFKNRFPEAHIKQVKWSWGFDDVNILDSSDPLFEKIGSLFIEIQTEEYGTDHLYSADTFNENLPPTDDPKYLQAMGEQIYQSMATADPKAIWIIQGWMFSYNADFWKPAQMMALLNAVPNDKMVVLDLWSESYPIWSRTNGYYGKQWIWNMLQNFGGNISLFSRLRHLAYNPSLALHDPDAQQLVGLGITPEGMEQNPATFQLMTDNFWRKEPIEINQWLRDYASKRYGFTNPQIEKAWDILKDTVYSGGKTEGGPESILTGRPTFTKNTSWTLTNLTYRPMDLIEAWKLFIEQADLFKKSDGFRYDLVDITRQVLANYATPLQRRWVTAWKEKDIAAFEKFSDSFLELMDDLDTLLASRGDFLLGPWLTNARKWGTNQAEKDLYEFNARDLITLWGDKDCPLHEYSCRQWSGLVSDFYKPRWEIFFKKVKTSLKEEFLFDLEAFDKEIKEWEWNWVNNHDSDKFPISSPYDSIEESLKVYKKYYPILKSTYGQTLRLEQFEMKTGL